MYSIRKLMSSIMFFDVFRFKGKTDTQEAMRKTVNVNGIRLHNFIKYSKWQIIFYLYAFHHFYVIWNYYFLKPFVFKAFRPQRTRHAVSLRKCSKNARRVPLNARKNLKNRQFNTLFLGYFCSSKITKPL